MKLPLDAQQTPTDRIIDESDCDLVVLSLRPSEGTRPNPPLEMLIIPDWDDILGRTVADEARPKTGAVPEGQYVTGTR